MTSRASQSFTYSTSKPIRDSAENQLNPPTISSIPLDFNKDGVFDQWNVTMRIRKPSFDLALS
jgi:hypothetical protein